MIIKTMAIIGYFVGSISLGFGIGNSIHTKDLVNDLVYTACNTARISAEIKEYDCGKLQDKYNREFICNSRGNSPDIHCWVEEK